VFPGSPPTAILADLNRPSAFLMGIPHPGRFATYRADVADSIGVAENETAEERAVREQTSPPPFFGSADSGGVTKASCVSADCKGVAGGQLRLIAVKTRRVSGSADSTRLMAVGSGRARRVHGKR
jgi:hypothetical protein